ncbi:MAG TPA: hypothetical protein DCL35_05350 [Candidatus Omnitrophica bacterium]|nr:hypothetical protein [Candidatus Omnitrophota bacterium]
MIDKLYELLLRVTSRPKERGEYSAGYWQAKIRQAAIGLAGGYTGRLLEVGCGEGLFLKGLHRINAGLRLYGVDSWDRMLERARQLLAENENTVTFSKADGRHLPFDNGFFDAVVCVNVFLNVEGLSVVRQILEEMARVCRPGGRIIVEFRNSFNPLLVLKFRLASFYDATVRERKLPLNTYRREDIVDLLKGFDFSVTRGLYLDFPIKKFAPIIILEAQKNV